MKTALAVTTFHLRTDSRNQFDRFCIYTAANRRYMVGRTRYEAYNREFGLRVPIKKSDSNVMRGIYATEKLIE